MGGEVSSSLSSIPVVVDKNALALARIRSEVMTEIGSFASYARS